MPLQVYTDTQVATATTTDGTETTLIVLIPPTHCTIIARLKVMARNETSDDAKGWIRNAVIRRNGDADVQVAGVPFDGVTQGDLGAALWSVRIDVNSPEVQVKVTGVAGQQIEWGAQFVADVFENVL